MKAFSSRAATEERRDSPQSSPVFALYAKQGNGPAGGAEISSAPLAREEREVVVLRESERSSKKSDAERALGEENSSGTSRGKIASAMRPRKKSDLSTSDLALIDEEQRGFECLEKIRAALDQLISDEDQRVTEKESAAVP